MLADGTDANSSGIALAYAAGLIRDFNGALLVERGGATQAVAVYPRVWFNPELNSRHFMVPGVLALLLLVITANLSSMAIVRERELGTLEQLSVTPMTRWELMLGKLLPYGIIGLIDAVIVVLVAVFWFEVPLKGSVLLINAETGAESTLGSHDWRSVSFLAWLPDGKGLVVNAVDAGGEASSQVWTMTYPDGVVTRVTNDLSTYSGVGLAGDGASFVSVRNETRTRLWTIPDGHVEQVHEITAGAGTDDGVAGFAWTPDKRIVYASSTTGNTDIWIMNPDGSNRVQLTNSPAADESPLVSPDGKLIVFVSGMPSTPE